MVKILSQQKNIIEKINSTASSITENDIESLIPALLDHYSSKIRTLAHFTYGSDGAAVAQRSFQEDAREELRKGLETFIFTSQHWRTGRDINSYLLTCLNRLSDRIKSELDGIQKTNVPVCPGCRSMGNKEFLLYENKLLRCNYCTSEISRIESELYLITDEAQQRSLEAHLRVHKVFSLHTRQGYRCPECDLFIPQSYIENYGVSCPYSDCIWFGTEDELSPMAHPLGLSTRKFLSLNINRGSRGEGHWSKRESMQDFIKSDHIGADIQLEAQQSYEQEHEILSMVIQTQMKRIQDNESSVRALQKVLMYRTYSNMLERYPEDMVSYLVHMKHSGSSPIQSRIFQEYIRQVENHLPFSIFKGGKEIEIYSLQDPTLNLFLGISEFEAVIRDDLIIPNNTKEIYIGGRKLKNYGPCFIGMVIDITDMKSGESIKDKMDSYTFVKILMKDVEPGTKVNVKHFRTHSHYEMGGLVHLQRLRRKIVDSVYRRLHGKPREIRNG